MFWGNSNNGAQAEIARRSAERQGWSPGRRLRPSHAFFAVDDAALRIFHFTLPRVGQRMVLRGSGGFREVLRGYTCCTDGRTHKHRPSCCRATRTRVTTLLPCHAVRPVKQPFVPLRNLRLCLPCHGGVLDACVSCLAAANRSFIRSPASTATGLSLLSMWSANGTFDRRSPSLRVMSFAVLVLQLSSATSPHSSFCSDSKQNKSASPTIRLSERRAGKKAE